MAGRICGSKLVEEVIATETNLEVISLRIFKSMGTDEITREQGSEKGEAALAPTPRTPAIQWDHKPQEVRDMRFRHRCTSSPTSVPGLGQTPTKALPLWRLERGGTEAEGKAGGGEKPEENAGRRERPPGWTPCNQESEICQHRGDCHRL